MPGAKLCSACRSALKRARHDPVSVVDPLDDKSRRSASRRRSKEASPTLQAAAQGAPRRRSWTPAWVGATAAVLCVAAFLVLQTLDTGARADATLAPVSPTGATAPTPALSVVAASAPPTTSQVAVPDNTAPVAADVPPPPAPAPAPRRAARPRPSAPPEPRNDVDVSAMPDLPAPAPVVVAPPAVKVAAPPDRATRLRSAFSACSQADIIERAMCQQRARVEMCDGFWGQLPQCPAQRDYGN